MAAPSITVMRDDTAVEKAPPSFGGAKCSSLMVSWKIVQPHKEFDIEIVDGSLR
jgi:hypothetical protein